MAADLRETQENQGFSENQIDKSGFMVLYASYSESEYNSCYKPKKNKCPGNNAFIPVI